MTKASLQVCSFSRNGWFPPGVSLCFLVSFPEICCPAYASCQDAPVLLADGGQLFAAAAAGHRSPRKVLHGCFFLQRTLV